MGREEEYKEMLKYGFEPADMKEYKSLRERVEETLRVMIERRRKSK